MFEPLGQRCSRSSHRLDRPGSGSVSGRCFCRSPSSKPSCRWPRGWPRSFAAILAHATRAPRPPHPRAGPLPRDPRFDAWWTHPRGDNPDLRRGWVVRRTPICRRYRACAASTRLGPHADLPSDGCGAGLGIRVDVAWHPWLNRLQPVRLPSVHPNGGHHRHLGHGLLIMWLAPVANEVWEHGFSWATARSSVVPLTAVLLLALLLGSVRLAFFQPTSPTVRVAALSAERALWDSDEHGPAIDDLLARTRREAQAGAKIVSWAEAAAFVRKEDEAALIRRAEALAREQHIYLQLGLIVELSTEHFPFAENRAILIDPSGQVVQNYFKVVHPLGDADFFAPGRAWSRRPKRRTAVLPQSSASTRTSLPWFAKQVRRGRTSCWCHPTIGSRSMRYMLGQRHSGPSRTVSDGASDRQRNLHRGGPPWTTIGHRRLLHNACSDDGGRCADTRRCDDLLADRRCRCLRLHSIALDTLRGNTNHLAPPPHA